MAQLKSHEIDTWLKQPRPGTAAVLIYGPDRGLVSERAQRFAALCGLPLDDPFSVVRMEAGDLEKSPGRLLSEADTIPMFAANRLLWVRNAGAQKALADDVKAFCAAPPAGVTLLIEAGDLKKSAPLRTVVESSRDALALPCYADDARAIDALIEDEMRTAGLKLAPDAHQALRASLGGDRMASRAELRKLALYAMGRETIELADVAAAIGDVSAISVEEAVDAALVGNLAAFDGAFSRHMAGSGQAYAVLSATMRQMQGLQSMRAAMDRDRKSASAAVAAARPPVFFARRNLVETQLERWDRTAISRVLARLQEAVLQSRKRPDLATALTRQALMSVAVESVRRSRSKPDAL
jgi:DNA polymerase-3 subunit delta